MRGEEELDKLEVGGHHLMAAERAEGVDGMGLGNSAPDNGTPSESLGDEFNGSPNSNEKTATEPTKPVQVIRRDQSWQLTDLISMRFSEKSPY
jgi:hypothetical protein